MGRKTAPADDAVNDQTKTDLAAGKDPFGDDEVIEPESIEAQAAAAAAKLGEGAADEGAADADADDAAIDTAAAAAAAAAAADTAGKTDDDAGKADDKPADDAGADTEGGTTDQAADDAGDADEDDDAALEPRPYAGKPVAELESKLTELEAKEAAEFKKLMAGEIDDDAFSKTKSEVAKESRSIQTDLARAEAARDRIKEYQDTVIIQQAKAAAKEGVVYIPMLAAKATEAEKAASIKATKQFDVALNMLGADPDNNRRSYKSLVKEAHAMVLARQGIAKAATTTPPAAAAEKVDKTPPPRVPAKGPPSLRNVPVAATPNAGGGVAEMMGALKGQAYEDAFSKLNKAQRDKLLDE